jgi:hypothetical protein
MDKHVLRRRNRLSSILFTDMEGPASIPNPTRNAPLKKLLPDPLHLTDNESLTNSRSRAGP